ncbi:MAG: hypothetical protein J6A59_01500 [Lachnospiraceae bacterium]|nr:hypothetical protein [Lachnospiraceae bacterium]
MLNSFIVKRDKRDLRWTMGILVVELVFYGIIIFLDLLYVEDLVGSLMIHTFMICSIIYTVYRYFSDLYSYLEVGQEYLVCNKWLHDNIIIAFQDVLYIKIYSDIDDGTKSYYIYYKYNNDKKRLKFQMQENFENLNLLMNTARHNHWEIIW